MNSFSIFIRSLMIVFSLNLVFAILLIILSQQMIKKSSDERIFSKIEDVPYNKVGLVLGTSKYKNSKNGVEENPFYKQRMEIAATLYHEKKVKYLLVSGDNREIYYNEPEKMKNSLLELGVKPEHIIPDYGGRRTLDSVIRAKKIFGLDRVTIISQNFHNQRAVFLANYLGINAIAYNTDKETEKKIVIYSNMRENLARVKAIFDVIFKVDAQIKGKRIRISA